MIDPPPTYASNALAAGTVVAFAPAAIATANDAPVISAAKETTLHMAAPAAELVSSPGTVAAASRSIFQTDSLRHGVDRSHGVGHLARSACLEHLRQSEVGPRPAAVGVSSAQPRREDARDGALAQKRCF